MADSQDYTTIIGPDAKFKGDLSFDSAAKLLGSFEGSINAKGKLLVANGSKCKATVSAKEVTVEGHVQGNIQATDRVDVKPKGMITGDIVAARMSMAEGASINGHCRIGAVGGEEGHKSPSVAETKPEVRTAVAAGKG